MKTLIRNGRVVTAVDDYKADVLIEAVLIVKGGHDADVIRTGSCSTRRRTRLTH